jgi:subtilisin family serine protease
MICVGSGNEAAASGHTSGQLQTGVEYNVEFGISTYESKLNLQIWKYYMDQVDIALISPGGQVAGPIQELLGKQRFLLENTEILLYYGEPAPYTRAQEIYLDFIPSRNSSYLNSGIWKIRFVSRRIVEGEFHMWLPGSGSLNFGTGFLLPTPNTTLTIPSTATKVLTVGAYDSALNSYASFSGRGYTRITNQVKPELVAPGVGIEVAAPGGGTVSRTGTSFATPFVSGAAALLMEWGIVRGYDPYLYGEKLKAYLLKGARPLPGFAEYPNPQLGYGSLCVEASLPI